MAYKGVTNNFRAAIALAEPSGVAAVAYSTECGDRTASGVHAQDGRAGRQRRNTVDSIREHLL